jgi:hypothetical protein
MRGCAAGRAAGGVGIVQGVAARGACWARCGGAKTHLRSLEDQARHSSGCTTGVVVRVSGQAA